MWISSLDRIFVLEHKMVGILKPMSCRAHLQKDAHTPSSEASLCSAWPLGPKPQTWEVLQKLSLYLNDKVSTLLRSFQNICFNSFINAAVCALHGCWCWMIHEISICHEDLVMVVEAGYKALGKSSSLVENKHQVSFGGQSMESH